MYLHLGKGTVVPEETVVGIFDLDITSQSHLTRRFLAAAEKAGEVINAAEDIPKSFLVCAEDGKHTVYLSQMSCATLLKRSAERLDSSF
ncbi:MAG: DUF370 domain-containing protein [Oscillospiraceae bacterium]|nr:DUF370 domain-containing protein [Oscillospiraceae bacterium]MBR3186128.1 DUF370 domain-containing protein [Oscillospiraceae bacterium]